MLKVRAQVFPDYNLAFILPFATLEFCE